MTIGLRPYPQYKDSGVEWLREVPEHWEVRRMKTCLSSLESGAREQCEAGPTDGIPNLGGEHIGAEGQLLARNMRYVSRSFFENLRKGIVQPKDILLVKDGATIGKTMFMHKVHYAHCSVNEHVFILRSASNVVPAFLYHTIRTRGMQESIWLEVTGSAQPGLNSSFVRSVSLVVPPLSEQAAIVRYLNYMDTRIRRYIRAQERLVKLLEEQKKAIIHQAVTRGLDPNARLKPSGVPWLGDIPEGWEVKKLKFEMKFQGGGTPSKADPSYWNGHIPWVSPKDMKTAVISDTEDHITEAGLVNSSTNLVPAGSVLMVVRSGILQRTIPIAICTREVALNQDMKALASKGKIAPLYFLFLVQGCENLLLTEWTKKGATVESIEHQFLANTYVPIPSVEEQNQIVRWIEEKTGSFMSALSAAQRKISLLREYRTRLISDVVTGKLDVRETAASLPEEALEEEDRETQTEAREEEPTEIQEEEA